MTVPNAARVANEQGPWRRMTLGSSQTEIQLNEKSLYVVDPQGNSVDIDNLTRLTLDGAKVEIKVKDGASGDVEFTQNGNIRVGPGATKITLTEGDTVAFRYDRDKDAGTWNQIYSNRVTDS